MKKFLSIVLSILMVVTMLPMAIMPASAAYDYDETTKLSFKITNLVREWKGETDELGESGSGFYEQSLSKVADGKYKYTYRAALGTSGGTWWSDPKTVTFDGVDCESDYYKTFEFTESTHAGGYTMTWTYTLEIKRSGSYGHLYSAWSDNGDGTHTRTCQINSTHVETLFHDWVDATCVEAKYCKTCGLVNGEPSSNAHNWGAWAPNGDGTHTRVCAWDNEHVEVEDCAYSDATCTALAKCSVCAGTTGDLNDKNHSGTTFTYEENSESLHNKYYACCGAFAKSESHTFNLSGLCTVCSYQCMHASYTDSICDVCKNECPHSDVGDDGVCTDCGKSGILYIDRQWDAATKTLLKFNRFTPPEADIKVTSSTSSMSNGWYIVEGDVTIPSRITVTGTVHLILCDGAVLDAQKGITVSEGNTLCVYAQSDGSDTGKLIATGDGFKAGIGGDNEERNGGTVTINGGIVTATGGAYIYNGAGIGGSYDGKGCTVTINGGVVTATGGGTDGAGIGGGESDIYKNSGCGGDVTINGGVVIAKGGWRAAGIGGGFKGNGGSVVITGGNVYAVDGDNEVNIGHGIGGKNSGSLKDADGNNVYLNTITLSDAADNTAVTELTGVTYGLTDVTTLDTNKLYFYLPSGAEATSITAGGVEYICNRNLTYYTEHEYTDATCITPQTCQYCGHTVGEATFSHNYVNGVCTVCGMGEADGIFYISTAEQLILFADYVNYVNKDADAVLMADIDLAEYTWTPIGVTAMGEGVTNGYTGSFDGNGHVIRNVTFATPTSAMAAGIFGTVQSGGTVRNLGVENITFDNNTYDHRAGGIAGQLLADSTISDCYVINSTVKASSRVVGGIVGMNNGTVKNCYTYNMTLAGYNNRFGGISGDFSAGKLENCYTDYSALASSQAGTATNCKAGVSADVFASGEIAYLLNGSTSEGDLVWGQDLDNGKPVQTTPTFNGAKVYCGYTSCGDTVAKYTNDETISAEKPDHTQKPTYTDNGNGTHSAVYSCCGTTVTEEHDFENDAHQCVCGKMETFTVSWFLSGSLMQSTSTYGQEFTQTFTVPENTHLRIDSVYLTNDASVPVNYTYENGVLTIAATDVPAADVYIDCDHNVLVTFHANGGEIIPEDGYPQEGSTDIFPEDGSYWTQEWNYGSEICLSNCAAVCREGYTFVDWRDASGQVHQVIPGNGNYTLATEDMTLYAQWQCNHTIGGVVFRDNGNGTHNGYCGECDELLGNYVEHPHNFGDNTYKCVCGYACLHDSYTDGVCDNCGYECSHEWGEGVLTRPTFESEGYYTYTCTLCGEEKTEPAEEADDTALNDASMKVTEYIDNDTLTQEAANEIHNSYLDILKNNGNIFDELGFVRNDLVEEDQPAIDAITEELQKIIADAEEKIASGEYVKADYTEIDEAIDDIEEKLASENITDEGKAELEEIKKQLEEMKADENTSAADVAELEKALEDYEEELDKGIEDGTLVEVDGDAIADDVNKKWAEKLEAEGLLDEYEDFINNQKATDEAMATVDEINDFANSLEGTVAENAENIAKLNEMLDSLFESWENCLRGTHNFNDYEVTSSAKCGENAVETRTCWFCGETDEREVEGTALSHSFTKYEETEAPKCGVAGKEVAYCDHGCQTTDEREIPALEHIFLDYVSNGDATCTADGTKTAECANGCGKTDTVTDEGSILDHTDKDGDKLCDECKSEIVEICPDCGRKAHEESGISLYICIIISFIKLVVSFVNAVK